MNLVMSGLDYSLAPIQLREQLSFTKGQVEELSAAIALVDGVKGCVLLSTCNRTELYLSQEEGENLSPDALLCQVAGVDYAPFAHAFVTRHGVEVPLHIVEVACGLKSQILGEDQILAQVKLAATCARENGTADSLLETVFRTAVSAGKEVKSQVRLTNLPTSAPHRGVMTLEETCGELAGKKALVIGNGTMGRLSAQLLRDKGCAVTVTLRSYHHGETVVPAGCAVVPYEERYTAMEGMDILFSATTSPHYTVGEREYAQVAHAPNYLVDLAVPRDISPAVGEVPQVTLFHVDNMGVAAGERANPEGLAQAKTIVTEQMEKLQSWWSYRNSLLDSKPSYPRFPLFIDLSGKKVVVVGGGTIACRRIGALLKFGADITVIAPYWREPVADVIWLERPYEAGDLVGATLAIAATDDRTVNAAIGQEAGKQDIPVSVADDASACTFYFPAVCMGGNVVAGVVSADGAHHSRTAKAAKAIRKTLEELP